MLQMTRRERSGKSFIKNKIATEATESSWQKFHEIIPHLGEDHEGDFGFYIGSHIGKHGDSLPGLLGFNSGGATGCFVAAEEFCQTVGRDTASLLTNYDIV